MATIIQADFEVKKMLNMAEATAQVGASVQQVAAQITKNHVAIAKWNSRVLVLVYSLLACILLSLFSGIAPEIVGLFGMFGLVATWFTAWMEGKRLYKHSYEQILRQLQEFIAGAKLNSKSRDGQYSTVYALAAAVDAKDHYTYGHSKKVAKYAVQVGRALGYSQEMIRTLHSAALLHDIGKIGVPEQVLAKPGPLTADEWNLMRSHVSRGVAILRHVNGLAECLPAILYHHERYDGSGYPSGLKGENIPFNARILAAVDSYDAMTSERPYRQRKMTHEQALEELEHCAGSQFDRRIVDAFVSLYKKPKPVATRVKQSLVLGLMKKL